MQEIVSSQQNRYTHQEANMLAGLANLGSQWDEMTKLIKVYTTKLWPSDHQSSHSKTRGETSHDWDKNTWNGITDKSLGGVVWLI